MKKTYFDPAKARFVSVGKLPKPGNARFGGQAAHFRSMCFETDAPEPPAPGAEEAALLQKIKDTVATTIQTRGFKTEKEVTAAIDTALKGLSLEALRSYEKDKTNLELQVTTLNGVISSMKNQSTNPAAATRSKTAVIKELLDKSWDKIDLLMRNKSTGAANAIVLNTRAAAMMQMGDAINESALNAVGQDIIESFSAEAFVPKRRPQEYIWELISRRTVTGITEYKTWLEEGGEDGAFAIVEEGALKPLMSKTLLRNVTKYRKMAGKRVYTEEFSKFRKEAYNIIESLFNDQIIRNYNAVITTSLNAKAASYVGTSLDGQYTDPTDYHAIGAVSAQIETLDFYPDLLIMNPQDKWRIGLEQDSTGRFFTANIPVYNPSGTVTMMGFRVFTSNRMEIGQAILGESGLYKVEDEAIQIRLAYGIDVVTDGDGFVTSVTSDVDHNRFRIIAETFFHDWIASNHQGSFVKFNFADVKAALLKPAI